MFLLSTFRKLLKIGTPKTTNINVLTFEQFLFDAVALLKGVDGMANSVDPSKAALVAEANLSH